MLTEYATLECRVCREGKSVPSHALAYEVTRFHCSACGSRVSPRLLPIEPVRTGRAGREEFMSVPV